MSKNLLKLVEFIQVIFPEVQVLSYIKQKGFFNKKILKNGNKSANYIIRGTKHILEKVSKDMSNTLQATKSIENVSINNLNKKSLNFNKSKEDIDKFFEVIKKSLPQYVLGQDEYLNKLLIAFKRPFIYGKSNGISNTIFIIGPNGSGRHFSIDVITGLLKENKIVNCSGFIKLDLNNYKFENDSQNLFLCDFYNAIYSNEPVIVFDNFDKCHSNILDIISKLIINDKIKLNKRYVEQLGKMIDVTGNGAFTLNTTDELLVDGKYIIFITEKDENYIRAILSNDCINKVNDIIHTKELNLNELLLISRSVLNRYKTKIENNLQIIVNFDDYVLTYIVKNIDKNNGAHGLELYIEENIYKPLVQLELTKKISNDKEYKINVNDNKLILTNKLHSFNLQSIIDKSNLYDIKSLNKELDEIIGLDSVKEFIRNLENNIKVQSLRKMKGAKEIHLALHMIFTGNPGTGKTTIARIVAKYLKALGYLSSGHLVEVSRNNLVGQYVGETAQKTIAKVNSAIGGVLFIDEAYSLVKDNNDIFGIECVDTLVKSIEDNRNNLVVILAGYTNEMEEFLKSNSGLKSRFNYVIEFPDYTPNELLEISKSLCRLNGYKLDYELDDLLLSFFKNKQIKGKNNGNGRFARNLIEKAIINQSKRLSIINKEEIEDNEISKLTIDDFKLSDKIDFNLEEELCSIIGLDEVKRFIRDLEKQLIAQEKRRKLGIDVETSQQLNMIFTGNPGTGKTTVARLIADLMKKMGILKYGKFIETDRSGLVGQYAGETAKKAKEVFESALGGVLFIDEAYSLMSSENDPLGREVVDLLVKFIEDFRNDIIVILAGYESEMNKFLDFNLGLRSRFAINVNFSDYNLDELLQIGKSMLEKKGFVIESNAEDAFKMAIDEGRKNYQQKSGNARLVRNIVERTIRKQSARIADIDIIDKKSAILLIKEDFNIYKETREKFDLESKLNEIVGLEEVKDFIRSLQAQIKIIKKRKDLGLPYDTSQTLHMIFKGNPGTGKTTMARIIGEVLYNIGVLNSKKFVETDRSGLVAGYVGQTAIKTKEMIDSAIGGILFIDEAYSLSDSVGSNNDFGKEAIDTLVKSMDDNRENLLVILAGYSEDMDKFLNVNPGLKSRFTNIIEFKDYSVEDLLKITNNTFKSKGYIITNKANLKIKEIIQQASKTNNFGNGRFVRNLCEKSIRNQAVRLESIEILNKKHLTTIEECDISEFKL